MTPNGSGIGLEERSPEPDGQLATWQITFKLGMTSGLQWRKRHTCRHIAQPGFPDSWVRYLVQLHQRSMKREPLTAACPPPHIHSFRPFPLEYPRNHT
jgi:hypothetical protein